MSNYKNGSGNVPRLPDRVVDTLINSSGVSCLAVSKSGGAIDQQVEVERLVHDVCEELLARLPESRTPAAPVVAEGLVKLKALALAATPGEWSAKPYGRVIGGPLRSYVNGNAQSQIASFSVTAHDQDPDGTPDRQQANAEFCAAANPAAVLSLIALAEAAHPVAGSPAGAHPDDVAVDRFAAAMKEKMAKSRAQGRWGWNDSSVCPAHHLRTLLCNHVGKGDPVDVGNFAMMLFNRGERTAAAGPMPASEAVGYVDPLSITNLKAGVSTNEWLWAKPEAGNVPLYTAAPVPASEAEKSIKDDAEIYGMLRDYRLLPCTGPERLNAIYDRIDAYFAAPAAPTDKKENL